MVATNQIYPRCILSMCLQLVRSVTCGLNARVVDRPTPNPHSGRVHPCALAMEPARAPPSDRTEILAALRKAEERAAWLRASLAAAEEEAAFIRVDLLCHSVSNDGIAGRDSFSARGDDEAPPATTGQSSTATVVAVDPAVARGD